MPSVETIIVSSTLVGAVFLVSAVSKIVTWPRFRDTLSTLELMPPLALPYAAALLPLLECLAGISVVLRWRPELGGSILASLLMAFIAALSLHRLRGGKDLLCGCFADFERRSRTSFVIARNLGLFLCLLPLLRSPSQPAPVQTLEEGLLIATVPIGLALAIVLVPQLVETVSALLDRNDARALP